MTARVLRTIKAHDQSIFGIAFSHDGKLLATASRDDSAKVFDTKTGKLLHHLVGHKRNVYRVAFSPDGKSLASSSKDNTARIWDLDSGKTKLVLKHDNRVMGVAFTPDGNIVTGQRPTGRDGVSTVHVWDPKTGKKLRSIAKLKSNCLGLAISPDGKILGAALEKGAVVLEAQTYKPLFTLTEKASICTGITFSSDSKRVVASIAELTDGLRPGAWSLAAWDMPTKNRIWAVEVSDKIVGVPSADSSSNWVALPQPADQKISIRRMSDGSEVLSLDGEVFVESRFHPTESILAGAVYTGVIVLWAIEAAVPSTGK